MFYDRFMQLCLENDLSLRAVAMDLGINQSTVAMWKNRGSLPNAGTLMAIADYFNTTPAYLMGNDMAKEPLLEQGERLSPSARRIGRAYERATKRDRGLVEHLLEPYLAEDTPAI